MCSKLGVSRAGYYKWSNRSVPAYEKENIEIAQLVKEYDDMFSHILGYRRMTDWINTFNHTDYSRKHVHRIMKKLNVHSVIRKKKSKYLYSNPETTAENVLQRDFNATHPNEKWATDVTEFKIPNSGKKIYLSAIIDLYDRSIISYVTGKSNNNALVFKTFNKAVSEYPDARPIFHSDRGFQYTSKVFKFMLNNQGMTQSMSRVGHCIDNCPTEGLWGIIKSEMYCMHSITDESSLTNAIEEYIDFYNNIRIQERFEFKTPSEVRENALKSDIPTQYPIAENKRIAKYKAKFIA